MLAQTVPDALQPTNKSSRMSGSLAICQDHPMPYGTPAQSPNPDTPPPLLSSPAASGQGMEVPSKTRPPEPRSQISESEIVSLLVGNMQSPSPQVPQATQPLADVSNTLHHSPVKPGVVPSCPYSPSPDPAMQLSFGHDSGSQGSGSGSGEGDGMPPRTVSACSSQCSSTEGFFIPNQKKRIASPGSAHSGPYGDGGRPRKSHPTTRVKKFKRHMTFSSILRYNKPVHLWAESRQPVDLPVPGGGGRKQPVLLSNVTGGVFGYHSTRSRLSQEEAELALAIRLSEQEAGLVPCSTETDGSGDTPQAAKEMGSSADAKPDPTAKSRSPPVPKVCAKPAEAPAAKPPAAKASPAPKQPQPTAPPATHAASPNPSAMLHDAVARGTPTGACAAPASSAPSGPAHRQPPLTSTPDTPAAPAPGPSPKPNPAPAALPQVLSGCPLPKATSVAPAMPGVLSGCPAPKPVPPPAPLAPVLNCCPPPKPVPPPAPLAQAPPPAATPPPAASPPVVGASPSPKSKVPKKAPATPPAPEPRAQVCAFCHVDTQSRSAVTAFVEMVRSKAPAVGAALTVDGVIEGLGPVLGPFDGAIGHCFGGKRQKQGPEKLFWAHDSCLLWCPEVYENDRGQFMGLDAAFRRSCKGALCSFCGQRGATLECHVEGCFQNYHVACAMFTGQGMDEENYIMFCHKHI